MWGVGCGVWGVGCGVWGCGVVGVGFGVWNVECGVWGGGRGVGSTSTTIASTSVPQTSPFSGVTSTFIVWGVGFRVGGFSAAERLCQM